MKIVIVKSESLIPENVFTKIKSTIMKDYKETGILFLPCSFKCEIVEADEIQEKENDSEEGFCYRCIHDKREGCMYPCDNCTKLHPGPESINYFMEK